VIFEIEMKKMPGGSAESAPTRDM